MRKTLTTLAVTAAAFAVPMLGTGTAYAADSNLAVDTSAVQQIIAAGGGCTTTFVSNVEGTPLGTLYSITPGPTVTVFGGAVTAYEGAQVRNTKTFEGCIV
ncbi:MAG: hypothetical protein QOE05_1447 [Actinomycetota bacterium]|jgi:hypothetical protein|nr:hypothetical protein [Actinomycetota bacterium]